MVTIGHATVMPRCFLVWKIIETGENRGGAGLNRDATETNRGSPKPNPVKPLGPGSSRRSPGEAPIHSGIAQCRPGYQRFTQDHPGLHVSRSSPGAITVCLRVSSVFDSCPGGSHLLFITTGNVRRFTPAKGFPVEKKI